MSTELKNWIREVSQNPDLKDESILIRKGPEGNTLISIFHGKCCAPSISISKSMNDIEKTDIESHKETLIHQHG
jgi:hypothetical protein